MNVVRTSMLCLLFITICAHSCDGFFDVFLGSLVGHLFGDKVIDTLTPASTLLLGGPTKVASGALAGATPLLQSVVLGERFEHAFYSALGFVVPFASNHIAKAVEQSLTWTLDFLLIAAQTLLLPLDLIINKRELAGKSEELSPPKPFRTGARMMPENEDDNKHKPFDVDFMLVEYPELDEFLKTAWSNRDVCLQELICSVNAAPDVALTEEERELKSKFRSFRSSTKSPKRGPISPFEEASKVGTEAQTQAACQRNFAQCSRPFTFRTIFVLFQRKLIRPQ